MKYFGIFDQKTQELSDIELENLMLNNGLLEKKLIGTTTSIENNILNFTVSNTIYVKPSKELVEEYYKFIIDLYSSEILEIKLPFFKIFNDEIYGLDPLEQKKIALVYFKEIYNNIYKDVITIYDQRINNDGIVHTHNFNKLKMLHYQLEAYKINLSDTRSTLCYLTGDRKTYVDSNFIENETVQEVLEFEAWKQIIVELNSRFEFEDDFYSTNQNDEEKSIEDFIPSTNDIKLVNSKNNSTPFIDFLRHENKIEIEQIIKTHYSDLKGVSLRYLIEFLIDNHILLINYGDKTKIQKSLKMLFNNNDIGTVSSIFDIKIDRVKDCKYLNAKDNFLKTFEKII